MVSHLFQAPRLLAGGMLLMLITAGHASGQDVQVSNARLSLLPGEQPGAGYFQLHNTGDETAVLVGAQSEAFEDVEIHMSSEENGMAHMHAMEQVEIEAGERFEFAPKGHHLMFIGRLKTFSEGDDVEVMLEFDDAQQLSVTFDVVSPVSL
ncbi:MULTISPECIES: copper chaperone PCu(A)C [Halomonadaceae]|mgnify:CR=1 FL=1|uniref:copper chaperone PCu(A)C n=1 Tax=Halomonadaceae TaxID=28256 RepID=UPI00222EED1A|nr:MULTISPECIES: copper chaperone PCu(A)C [Halomonas]MCW4152451.1 copper chaperone PCu(A)C [Halomonas sp. 18H]MDR5886897.1 copper chaperone PCu(A)C [Halomonas janggokensis]